MIMFVFKKIDIINKVVDEDQLRPFSFYTRFY